MHCYYEKRELRFAFFQKKLRKQKLHCLKRKEVILVTHKKMIAGLKILFERSVNF